MEMVAGLRKPILPSSKPDVRLNNQGIKVSPLEKKVVLQNKTIVYLWPSSIRCARKINYLPGVNVVIDFRKNFSQNVIISYICWKTVEIIAPKYCIPIFKKMLQEIEEISNLIPKPGVSSSSYKEELHSFIEKYSADGRGSGQRIPALKAIIDCAEQTAFNDLFRDAKNHILRKKSKKRISHHTSVSSKRGPFTKNEMSQIVAGLSTDKLNSREKFIIAFLLEVGCRGLSLARMTHNDIIMPVRGEIRSIRIPPVKQRSMKRDIPLSVRKGLSKRLGEYYSSYLDEIPDNIYRGGAGPLISELVSEADETINRMFDRHGWGVEKINRSLRTSARKLDLRSDDGARLNLSVYRFRHTLGLRMACTGSSAEEIASALGHSGTDSVAKYIRQGMAMSEYIDRAMSSSDTHLEASSTWQNPQLARKEMKKIMAIGECSKPTPCELHPGYSCYTCSKFKPSADVDHRESISQISAYFDFFIGKSSPQVASSASYLKQDLIMSVSMFTSQKE